jgi:hypothetical protein
LTLNASCQLQAQTTTPYPSRDINEVVLGVMQGKRHKLRPQCIVAALTKDASAPAGLIDRISLEPKRGRFKVPRAVADAPLRDHGSPKLRDAMSHSLRTSTPTERRSSSRQSACGSAGLTSSATRLTPVSPSRRFSQGEPH